MATGKVFKNAFIEVNGKDLSTYSPSVTVNRGSEMLDRTAFGDNTRKRLGGLLDWSFDLTFHYDCSTAGPEAVLWNLVGTTSCWEFRPVNACSSANNPILSGIGTLENHNYGGQVGSLLTINATVQASGDLSRASSSG